MAQKPDGKPARTERVAFTRPAAERIAKVVREVEAGNRDLAGISFGAAPGGVASKTFRMATFTGAWSINSSKTVTYRGVTTTPNTVSATNLLLDLPALASTATLRNCAIAKDGTAWYLVFPQVKAETKTFVSDVTLAATLNTNNCTVTIARTLATSTHTIIVLEAL